ncbi:hypothetical protein EDC45_0089 [Mesocricetibacter intestinalis]|uniref:Pirin N-terminal domain-containing protein n=1 Tax=Mesocricetibacter intestinalis TaxID=1521930 RepID=A0A4R6VF12_9PAST|nr:pirin family protein [Mesocricetibacter intestinalis]TDQ59442.1 hypothetical protein EDC45_0089 [Mesocricetibacter intestinalis]
MLKLRKAQERGDGSHDWLQSRHSFSFADYYDPQHMHFSHLRVINEDIIAPGTGFGLHPHKDMEILTYVLSGTVEHRDSMGNTTRVNAGEFQIMSAGSGIFHSEINPSENQPLHLYQIWIIPEQKGITPRYRQGSFVPQPGATLILSPQAEQGSFKVYQDMKLWRYCYEEAQQENLSLNPQRSYWLQVVSGELSINGTPLSAGDALGIKAEQALQLKTSAPTEFLLFDLV